MQGALRRGTSLEHVRLRRGLLYVETVTMTTAPRRHLSSLRAKFRVPQECCKSLGVTRLGQEAFLSGTSECGVFSGSRRQLSMTAGDIPSAAGVLHGGTGKGKVVVISGPTAIGKSDIAVELARQMNGEIISADSVQVFKGLDIGANQVPEDEQGGVPHHLTNFVSLSSAFTVMDYYRLARKKTEEVLARGKTPFVVGGAGLYLQWYIHGPPDSLPPRDADYFPTLDARMREEEVKGAERVLAQLKEEVAALPEPLKVILDTYIEERPEIHLRRDAYRLRRLIDIIVKTGKGPPDHVSKRDQVEHATLDYDFRCFFLCDVDRERLYRSIDHRCEVMIARGLLKEVADLVDADQLGHVRSKSVGYRQTKALLEAHAVLTPDAFLSYLNDFKSSSRQLARKQMTWFRAQNQYTWVSKEQNGQHVGELTEQINLPVEDYRVHLASHTYKQAQESLKAEASYPPNMRGYLPQHTIFGPQVRERSKQKVKDKVTGRTHTKKLSGLNPESVDHQANLTQLLRDTNLYRQQR